MDTFTAGAMISWAWETFKKRPWFFIGITLLIAVASWLIGFISSASGGALGDNAAGGMLSFLVSLILQTLLGLGTTAFFLKAHDNADAAQSADLWHPQPFWQYLAASLLVGLVTMAGFILLIVPGIIAALMFMFTTYIVVDRGLGPVEAMKESYRITKGRKWELFILGVLLILVNILGAIALLVGLLVTIPLTSLAVVHAYRTLEHRASEVAPVSAA